jgi:hypothetical protein
MNLAETVELIAVLKAAGVSEFKSLEHNIVFKGDVTKLQSKPAPIAEISAENTEKAVDLLNTLKMSPEELANQIFPDGAY